MWITPKHRHTDFHDPLTFDDKVTIFYEQTLGWQLDIAEQVIDNINHSGFGALSIAVSYFEMISKYRSGFLGRQSRHHFKQGVHIVFPILRIAPQEVIDSLLDIFYDGCRCGLYHRGLTNPQVMLTGELETPIAYNDSIHQLIINPRRLITALEMDLENYIRLLLNPTNVQLRINFEQRFDYDSSH